MIPTAKVPVRNTNTGATYETITNADGQFSVPTLPPGPYEIMVEAASVTNPLFGQVASVSGNRVIQLGTRLDF